MKSESVLSLYRLELDGKSSCNRPTVIDICCKEANSRRFYKQSPGNRRILGQPTPLTRRLGQQTPPTRRINRQKKLPVPVLSVESLTTALNCAGVSYLDNGDLCRHGSVPDLKRVFVSDYIWKIWRGKQVWLSWRIFNYKEKRSIIWTWVEFSVYEMPLC